MGIHLSHSAVKTFRRCPKQFGYKYVEGLEPRLPSLPLRLGTWMHELMASFYQSGSWNKTHAKLTKDFNNLFLEEREYYGDLPAKAKKLMEAYEYRWRHEHDDWEVLEVEEEFEVERGDGSTFSFTVDLIVREISSGLILCVDHKTTRSIPDSEWRLYDLQSTLYMWGLELAGYNVDLFVYNYIRTKDPTVPSINMDGRISTRKIDTDYYTLATFLKDYYKDVWPDIPKTWKIRLKTLKEMDRYFKRSRIPKNERLTARQLVELDYTSQIIEAFLERVEEDDEDPWPRTMIRSCDWDCDFYDLCGLELMGNDATFLKRAKFQPSEYLAKKGKPIGR